MKSKKWILLLALPPALLFLGCLNWLTNWERERMADPVVRRNITEREQYRPDAWSEEIVTQDETTIWYEDRVRERFPTSGNAERTAYMLQGWKNFCACIPEGVDSCLVSIPVPILFEKEGAEDYRFYQDFIEGLSVGAGAESSVVDLYEALAVHKEEYIYYSETKALTNLGGYYAADGLLEAMGEEGLPALSEYEEELYYGTDALSELTYLYSLPGSRGYCELFTVEEDGEIRSRKKPILRKNGAGSGSVIAGTASRYNWAVAEGSGGEEKGVLLLIGDSSAKAMVPFLAEHFQQVYYVFLNLDSCFGTEYHPIDRIFEEYDVRSVVYAQWASDIGRAGEMAAFNELCRKK